MPLESKPVVFCPSLLQRALFVAASIGGGALMTGLAFTNSPWWAVFGLCSIPIFLDGIRTQVVVDPVKGEVDSTRAFLTRSVSITDVVNVHVPPWGPVVLTLREGTSKSRGGIRPGQVKTGLYSPHRGSDLVATRLGDALGVPVVSLWPAIRSKGKGSV